MPGYSQKMVEKASLEQHPKRHTEAEKAYAALAASGMRLIRKVCFSLRDCLDKAVCLADGTVIYPNLYVLIVVSEIFPKQGDSAYIFGRLQNLKAKTETVLRSEKKLFA